MVFMMAEKQHDEEDDCVSAFKRGDKLMAEQLLPRIPLPAVRTITTRFRYTMAVTLLHLAAYWGWGDVVTALVSVYYCAANSKDSGGQIPLHYAAYNEHVEVVKYFITELQCDPMEKDNGGWTPLHFACCNDNINIAQYLIRENHCNPSCEDTDGWTPLHYACRDNRVHIVQHLLSTGRVNPLTKNKSGFTALSYASGCYDLIKLFEPFEECRTAFPVHTFTKLILTGDSGAGKTTTAKHLVHLASTASSDVPVDCVANVERYTAGIVPHHIQSEQLGNFVVYDFAGQQEYYSSHAAVLEQVMRRSAAMFVCLIDLRKTNESICQSVHYWLSFIDNACSTAEGRSHVLIVGSHADQVTSSVEEKSSLLQTIIATRRVKRQEYVGCIAMDCRRPNTDASRRLITILANSQKAITASQPVIHYYSHVVYAFLRTKLTVVGCTLHDLVSAIDKENDSSLPSNQSVLTEILTTLSDKGLILFIHHPHSSWVVLKTNALLSEINGTLFAPRQFKEHRDILGSNTGIVSTSSLLSVFPHHNTDMLVGFLQSLDFCRRVEPSVLENTNLQTTPSHSATDLLFFPGLVQSERPDSLVQHGALEFGWCLRCVDSHKFFSSRFLHVLLLSVAYKFPLASQGLHRVCRVWRNGIFWRNYDDITTVIELLDNNRCVLVAMSCNDSTPIEHAKLRSSLIGLVRHLQQQYCPRLNVREFLISPDLIQRYPLDNLPDSDLFDIHHVAQCVLLRKSVVPSYQDGRSFFRVQSLPFEPYHQLSSSSVSQLLNPVMADQPVPAPLLHEVRKLCHHSKVDSLVYKELREQLDKLSLFAGSNPLVSCTVACDGSNVSLVCTGGG